MTRFMLIGAVFCLSVCVSNVTLHYYPVVTPIVAILACFGFFILGLALGSEIPS